MIRFPGQLRAASWVSAFALSLVAVGTLIVIEGSALLVGGADLFAPPAVRTSVIDLAWCETQRIGVATFWTGFRDRNYPFESAAALITPDSPHAEPSSIWPDLKPRRLALAGSQGGLAIACENGSLFVVQTISADARRLLIGRHPEGEPEALICTADGSVLVSKGPDYLCAWDIASQQLLWPAAARSIQCIVAHPQDAVLLCGRSDGVIEQRDARTGRVLRELAVPSGRVACIATFPDGQHIASLSPADEVSVWRLDTGELRWTASMLAASPRSLSVSPDGRWLAAGTLSGGRWKAVWFDAATGERHELAATFSNAIHGTQFTRSGQVLCWSADGTVCLSDRSSLSEVRRWSLGKAE